MGIKTDAIVDTKLKKILSRKRSGERGFEGYKDKIDYKFPLAKNR